MPIILTPEILETETKIEAGRKPPLLMINQLVLRQLLPSAGHLNHWQLDLNKNTEMLTSLLYVISGNGTVEVNGDSLPLDKESLLWLEQGDVYQFNAGEDGLEILQGYAPGG